MPFSLILIGQNASILKTNPDYKEGNYCFKGSETTVNYVDVINCNSAIGNQSAGSIEFYVDGTGDVNFNGIFSYVQTTTQFIRAYISGGRVYIIGRNLTSTDHVTTGGNAIIDGVTNKVIISSDGSSWSVSVNDINFPLGLVTGINTGQWFNNTSPNWFSIGVYRYGASSFLRQYNKSIWGFKIKDISNNVLAYYPCNETNYDFATFYDVSGNGNHATGSGTNFRAVCTENTSNDDGMTKVVYAVSTVLVPYLLSGTPLYLSVSPVLNAAEQTINYPASYWQPHIIVSNSKIVKQ